MNQLIQFSTRGNGSARRPIYIMANKIVSFMPAAEGGGTLIFAEAGVNHHVSNHVDDVKLLIELSIGGE
jgi:hypothetical protein